MYSEDELLPISALQHLLFCERQCALIHIERIWSENILTAEGRILHEKADAGEPECRAGVRILRGLNLRSYKLGLSGIADVVEFAPEGILPVEYKHGRPKTVDCDRVQLCAQALCLEEMLDTHVPSGALFYGKIRRREEVAFNNELRRLTYEAACRLHELFESGRTPPAVYKPICEQCSLIEICLPKARACSVASYLKRMTSDEEAS